MEQQWRLSRYGDEERLCKGCGSSVLKEVGKHLGKDPLGYRGATAEILGWLRASWRNNKDTN